MELGRNEQVHWVENLKPFEEFGFKDPRNTAMEQITRHLYSKETFYRFTEQFKFDDSVPNNIKDIWSVSLDLFNHCYFDFEFIEPSNLYSLMTVEAALKVLFINDFPDPEKITMGPLIHKLIGKYRKSHKLTPDQIKWLELNFELRNKKAHLDKKMFGPPFGMTMIPASFDFIWGLFCNPILLLIPGCEFLNGMNFIFKYPLSHPFTIYKKEKRNFDKYGLFGMGY